jgi:hypothetical protein
VDLQEAGAEAGQFASLFARLPLLFGLLGKKLAFGTDEESDHKVLLLSVRAGALTTIGVANSRTP